MLNRRKKTAAAEVAQAPAEPVVLNRPFDVSEVDLEDGAARIDLGGLLLAPVEGFEVRMQVEEATGEVQSILYTGADGALELRAFAASKVDSMWDRVRPQIAADAAQHGGTASEAEGPFGPELVCRVPAQLPDGSTALQETRIVGVDGPRWFVRATMIGAPVRDDAARGPYDQALRALVVRRGPGAMAPGDALQLTVPASARRA